MSKSFTPHASKVAIAAVLIAVAACTAKYDWREIHGATTPYTIMLPAKPATHSRSVNLDGTQVTMVMTAAEVDGAVFAIGTAELADAAQAQAALLAMKTAMVKNIDGRITRERTSANAQASASTTGTYQGTAIDLEAVSAQAGNGPSQLLVARFVAQDRKVYQAIVVGPEKKISREAVDTFFSSFKTN
ncbi:MAG: hypothetical protein H7315_20105 [Herminiimonas sp.]|nr:hypothetical protein [Herminiimonas sp.]